MIPSTITSQGDTDRSSSPIVIVSDPLGTTQDSTSLRADNPGSLTSATLRVRTDELKRSVSSPQVIIKNYNGKLMLYVARLTNSNIYVSIDLKFAKAQQDFPTSVVHFVQKRYM